MKVKLCGIYLCESINGQNYAEFIYANYTEFIYANYAEFIYAN